MPTYEYECTKCKHRFERFQSMKDGAADSKSADSKSADKKADAKKEIKPSKSSKAD